MKKILLFDNYDSFTHNIAHIIKEFGFSVDIICNDKISLEQVEQYDKILLSPGAGSPLQAGILLPIIRRYASTKSIFGICLGEQAIGEAFGATLLNLEKVYHGVDCTVKVIIDDPLFAGLGGEFSAGRYHSWVVDSLNLPATLQVTAVDKQTGQIMALRHSQYDVRGVQFHPESILTPKGKQIIKNWLEL